MASLAPPVRAKSAAPALKTAATPPESRERKPGVRPKLKVSQPHDPLEHDADRAADRVMRQAAPSFPMAGPRREREDKAHRKVEKARSEVESVHRAPQKKDDTAHRAGKKKDDTARRAPKKPDEKAHRASKTKDDTAHRASNKKEAKDESAHRAAKKKDDTAHRAEGGGNSGVGADGSPPGGFDGSLGQARQSGGAALDGGTLGFMEGGFGQSLDQVRIHSGGEAASLAGAIDARAFTVGHDVFFGAGQYQPHTTDGRRLLAHELAHVVQGTTGRRATDAVSREPAAATTAAAAPAPATADGSAPEATPFVEPSGKGSITKGSKDGKTPGSIKLPFLRLPTVGGGIKGAKDHPTPDLQGAPGPDRNPLLTGKPFSYKGKTPRGSTTARKMWIKKAQEQSDLIASIADAVKAKWPKNEEADAALVSNGQPVLHLRPKAGPQFYIVGTAEEVAAHELVLLPGWDSTGKEHKFDVDHMQELQLGGFDGWENFCLLDLEANRSSGRNVNVGINKALADLLQAARTKPFFAKGEEPGVEEIRNGWSIEFAAISGDLAIDGKADTVWTRSEIKAGKHLLGLQAMSGKEITNAGLNLPPGTEPKRLTVFTNRNGGYFRRINRSGNEWTSDKGEFYKGFDGVTIHVEPFTTVEDGHRVGEITGRAFRVASKGGKVFEAPSIEVPLLQATSLGFALFADREKLNKEFSTLNMKKMSPIVVEDAGLSADGALFVGGRIQASIPLLNDVEIPFTIYGDRVEVSFPIPTDKLNFGPVKVTDASLDISVGAGGLDLTGAAGFVVNGVGRGRLVAGVEGAGKSAGKGKAPAAGGEEGAGFVLGGSFAFDTDKLDPATIGIEYRNSQLTVDAIVGIKKGTLPGVDSATIHVFAAPDAVVVDGTAVLGIAGLKGVTLLVRRGADGTIEIGADNIPLPVDRIPGVSGATASVHATRSADTGDWRVSGGGSATIGIAGLAGTLRVAVDGDFFSIAGENLTLHRGPLEGSGAFLVSNQPRDEAGNPVPGPAGDMVASGHAEASMPLGPYLRGTIGGRFLPNGELQFMGSLALPPTLDLFDRRSYERDLFRPPSLDIPIFGITAAGQRIGIFATIGGALTFSAGIGPGQLRDTALTAAFNPDHPENTTVHGTANFVVPADAGLRLSIHGGIGAGIPIVSAEAGIEVGGQLGITAEASAAVTVDWSPAAGLSLEAVAHLQAQPQFTFDISAYLRIVADVVITEFELYNKHWALASFTFGPALAFGIDLPIHWTEQAGLDFDLNRIAIQTPDIDIRQLTTGLVEHLVS